MLTGILMLHSIVLLSWINYNINIKKMADKDTSPVMANAERALELTREKA